MSQLASVKAASVLPSALESHSFPPVLGRAVHCVLQAAAIQAAPAHLGGAEAALGSPCGAETNMKMCEVLTPLSHQWIHYHPH